MRWGRGRGGTSSGAGRGQGPDVEKWRDVGNSPGEMEPSTGDKGTLEGAAAGPDRDLPPAGTTSTP